VWDSSYHAIRLRYNSSLPPPVSNTHAKPAALNPASTDTKAPPNPLDQPYALAPFFANTPLRRNALITVLLTIGLVWTYFDMQRNEAAKQITAVGTPAETRLLTGDEFTMSVKGQYGYESYKFYRKTDASAEAHLKFHESVNMVGRQGNPVMRWDRNWVESNEPNEDRSAVDIIPGAGKAKGVVGEGGNDLMMVSVLDGHAGSATSELLRTTLHPTLAVGLAGLQAGIVPKMGEKGWWRTASEYLNPMKWISSDVYNPSNVCLAIQNR
jgi:pyruvate dehydrogenase phosphatase